MTAENFRKPDTVILEKLILIELIPGCAYLDKFIVIIIFQLIIVHNYEYECSLLNNCL